MNNERTRNTAKLAKMAMLVAISIVLVMIIHFPIFPMVAFLEYDPADIPILIGTFAFGPAAGVLLTVVTSVLQGITVSAGSGAYGIIMHILSTTTLTLVSGTIYRRHKTKKMAVVGLICGTIAMTIDPVSVMDFRRSVQRKADQEMVFRQELGPFFVDTQSIGLERIENMYAGFA